MDKLAAILDAARALSPDERRRLMAELKALEAVEPSSVSPSREPFAALRALSGTAHSDFADVLDLARSRRVEQEVLDLLDEPITR